MKSWIESRPFGGRGTCGDFVGCIELAPQRYAMIVGDVAGRDATACDAARGLLAYARNLVTLRVPMTTVLRTASEFFARRVMTDSTQSASLFIAVVDPGEAFIHYASAGHEPGLLLRGDGTHVHLEPTGPALGVKPAPAFRQRELPLVGDTALVLVTDGITEAHPPDGMTFFGSTGVVRAARHALLQGENPARAICSAAAEHAGGDLTDNASVVVSSLPAPSASSLRTVADSGLERRGKALHQVRHLA